jgi:integrase
MKLTSANIKLPEGKNDHLEFDDTLKGFGLRIRRGSGDRIIRNWIIAYRAHGHQRRMIVGSAEKLTPAQARQKARKLLSEVELGGDPQADKRERRDKDEVSLRSIIKDFLEHKTGVRQGTLQSLTQYLQGPCGARAQKQGIEPYLKPLHGMPIDRITRADIARRVLTVSKEHGEPTGIAFRSALNSLFAWAMTMGLTEHNPVIGAFKPPKQASRDRVLSNSELVMIWKALADDDYGKVIKLLICTGARRAEIGGMRWSEFSPDMDTWTLSSSRSKTGKPHTVPVTPLMLSIIESVPKRDRFDILFGRKNGFTVWASGKEALDKRIGLKPWVHHDIRRSVATGMNDIGIQPHIVEQILNHQSGSRRGVAGIYNRSPYEREVKAAMALWNDHVRSLIEGGKRKVVAFKHAAINANA